MKYRKKPLVIEAIQWTGSNRIELKRFCGEYVHFIQNGRGKVTPQLQTLEGTLPVPQDYFVIRGVHGEYYPCEEEAFYKTYEKVE